MLPKSDHAELPALAMQNALDERAVAHLIRPDEEQVHAAWERLLPADHPNLLAAKNNLAATRWALGDLAGALAFFEHVHTADEHDRGCAEGRHRTGADLELELRHYRSEISPNAARRDASEAFLLVFLTSERLNYGQ